MEMGCSRPRVDFQRRYNRAQMSLDVRTGFLVLMDSQTFRRSNPSAGPCRFGMIGSNIPPHRHVLSSIARASCRKSPGATIVANRTGRNRRGICCIPINSLDAVQPTSTLLDDHKQRCTFRHRDEADRRLSILAADVRKAGIERLSALDMQF